MKLRFPFIARHGQYVTPRMRPDPGQLEKKVTLLSKKLDEEVVRFHLAKLGVKLTDRAPIQADYIGVDVDG